MVLYIVVKDVLAARQLLVCLFPFCSRIDEDVIGA